MQCVLDDESDDFWWGEAYDKVMVEHAPRTQLQSFAYGNAGASSSALVETNSGAAHASISSGLPFCPYPSCPGVFTHCGGRLSWKSLEDVSSGRGDHSGFFGCERFFSNSRCSYRYWPHAIMNYAQISMEMEASGKSFKVVAAPGK